MSSVGDIVTDLASMVGVTDLDTTAINSIIIRGFVAANVFNAADAIRTLQRAFFFDLVEIDGELVAVLRGGAIEAVISRADMVKGSEAVFETARAQSVEFPQKLHISYASAETDYTPTKQTSERRSADILSVTEVTVEVPVNFEADDAVQVADKMHKTAWAELEGTIKLAVPEYKYARLVSSDLLSVEVNDGVYKRCRIEKINDVDGVRQLECVVDRQSASSSGNTAPPTIDPVDPGTNLPAASTYEIMDLPVLLQSHDSLNLYFSAYGAGIWTGATIDQLIDTEWVERGTISYPETMGTILEALPNHIRGVDSTNTLLITLSDTDIAAITQTEFDLGGNAILIGDEIMNFRDVLQSGDNYRISHFNRGGLDTTPATHAIGTRIVLLVNPSLITMEASFIGQLLTYRVYTFGTIPAVTDEQTITYTGQSQIEWAPLGATKELISGDWEFEWSHNKRIGAPNSALISGSFIEFAVRLTDSGTTITLKTDLESLTYTSAEQTADFGGAVTAWDLVEIYGMNVHTGEGRIANPADISGGDKLLFEDSSGYLMFEDDSGILLLE